MKNRNSAALAKPTDALNELLSVRDLMIITGESEQTWRQRIKRREIATVRLGASVRVRRRDFEHYLDEQTTPRR